ncbi:MAG: succinic semialdehyde dehydrogenase [Actinomycetota bacterium]|nr:succinic semialdehyde dehydrogenase [Actinomycetota bacterium]
MATTQTELTSHDVPEGASIIAVENPATGEVIATIPAVRPDDVAGLVARARAAQPLWEDAGFDERCRILSRAQKWLLDHEQRVIDTLVSETGKTYEDALMVEVGYLASALGFWVKRAPGYLKDERIRSASPVLAGRKLVKRYRPIGVVGVIGPWNFPLVNAFGDCVPALAAGNAVILKPSELTPLTSQLMRECLLDCGLPQAVFQVAPGYGDTGAALVDSVDMVMFTGSTETGRKVAERAGRRLIPVSLELGGKDPMIVLSDADLERAANAAVYGGLQNAGQACTSVERVYVEAPVYDEFVGKVADKVRGLRQGPPAGAASVDVGAMTSPEQVAIVDEHVSSAVQDGARALTGGHRRAGAGNFYEPTVLIDADHSMTALREETFGPTLPIVKVADAREAIALANDSEYGLSGSVWTGDLAQGEKLARHVQAGAVCVNDVQLNYFALELPMGGWKASGLGVRHGAEGIRKYCRQQSILVTRFAPLKRDPHMMPYTRTRTTLMRRLIRTLYGRGKRD